MHTGFAASVATTDGGKAFKALDKSLAPAVRRPRAAPSNMTGRRTLGEEAAEAQAAYAKQVAEELKLFGGDD